MEALRYGPLIYSVERADQRDLNAAIGSGPLTPEWRSDLLQGVMTIKGQWADGRPLVAIPNYARNNRAVPGARPGSGEAPGAFGVDYSGGATVGTAGSGAATNAATTNARQAGANQRRGRSGDPTSMVWIKD
jgi:hypothetical protein